MFLSKILFEPDCNQATTWEDLIDHRKLPYMAMLRNIRNLIKAGISDKHHNLVIKKISDEGSVRSSKQSSFRFFSAYDVLKDLEAELEKAEAEMEEEEKEQDKSEMRGVRGGRVERNTGRGGRGGRGSGRGGARGGRGGGGGRGGRGGGGRADQNTRGHNGGRGGKRGKNGDEKSAKKPVKNLPYTTELVGRYKKSLDEAVRIATVFNTKQIPGSTLVFIDLGDQIVTTSKPTKSLGKSVRTPDELAYLLALQASVACEDCKIIGYGQSGKTIDIQYDQKETILGAVSGLGKIKEELKSSGVGVLPDLTYLVHDQVRCDNIIVFSVNSLVEDKIKSFVGRYQRFVNPKLLFVDVSLTGTLSTQNLDAPLNYVKISGFSDHILRFVGERGDAAQVLQVENVDLKFGLRESTDAVKEKTASSKMAITDGPILRAKPVKVFISSTFKDFHSERNILTQFVFPEIKSRASLLGIDVQEVDLRWGITEEESMRQDDAIERCLQEVNESFMFIGMIGERYGSVPKLSISGTGLAQDMVRKYPGASITELECMLGLQKQKGRAFFFFRHNAFLEAADDFVRQDFTTADSTARERLQKLRKMIAQSGHETFLDYPCQLGGLSKTGKPVLIGLEEFAIRALTCI